MIFYDGQYLCAEINKGNYDKLFNLAETLGYEEYIESPKILCFAPTRRIAKELQALGLTFDESAKIFLSPKESASMAKLYPFQREGVQRMLSTKTNILLADEMGCIDGESLVTVKHRGFVRKLKLSDFYRLFHKNYKYNSKHKYYIKCSDTYIYTKYTMVYDVIDSGIKNCVKVTMSSGKELYLTHDHELITTLGAIPAIASVGKHIYCEGSKLSFRFGNIHKEVVKYVEEIGERHVYDIKCININNFFANKILVHNCGKTVQVATYLKENKESLPALIICPASLKLNWARELKTWCNIDSYVIWGKQEQLLDSSVFDKYKAIIINYDILGTEDKEEKEKELNRRKLAKATGQPYRKRVVPVNGWCDILATIPFKTIICDEVQFIAEDETIRARGVIKICKKLHDSRKIFVSGTPYETKTSQFYTALSLLNPDKFNNRYKFLMKYCDPKKTFFGWKFDGASNTEELREEISDIMIRRLKSEVLTQLPPKIRSVVPMTVSAKDRQAYEEIDRQFEEDIRTGKKKKQEQIGHIAHLKKGAYMAKENAVIGWVKDFLDSSDEKLILFVWHNDSFNRMMDTFKSYGAVGINGSTPTKDRQTYIDSFQNNKNIRLFVGQIQACGAGITLTASHVTVFTEFGRSWVQHEQAEARNDRISQKADSVLIYYLILENSIEEDIMQTLNRRNRDMKLVMDGEKVDSVFAQDMNEDILKSYKERKNLK